MEQTSLVRKERPALLPGCRKALGMELSVFDTTTSTWIEHVDTGKKAHSVAADPLNNHNFPQNGRGIVVYAET